MSRQDFTIHFGRNKQAVRTCTFAPITVVSVCAANVSVLCWSTVISGCCMRESSQGAPGAPTCSFPIQIKGIAQPFVCYAAAVAVDTIQRSLYIIGLQQIFTTACCLLLDVCWFGIPTETHNALQLFLVASPWSDSSQIYSIKCTVCIGIARRANDHSSRIRWVVIDPACNT